MNSREEILNQLIPEQKKSEANMIDHSEKRILARGCDPYLSEKAAVAIPPLIGNPEYIPTTNDEDFFEKLQNEKWSVIYFAPGACRFSAAKMRIPGSNESSKQWTLEEYKDLIRQWQGKEIVIVETPYESESIDALRKGLAQV